MTLESKIIIILPFIFDFKKKQVSCKCDQPKWNNFFQTVRSWICGPPVPRSGSHVSRQQVLSDSSQSTKNIIVNRSAEFLKNQSKIPFVKSGEIGEFLTRCGVMGGGFPIIWGFLPIKFDEYILIYLWIWPRKVITWLIPISCKFECTSKLI